MLATFPSSSRKISILPCPSSRVMGSIAMAFGHSLLPSISGRPGRLEQRMGHAELIESAGRVDDPIQDGLDLLRIPAVDDRGPAQSSCVLLDPALLPAVRSIRCTARQRWDIVNRSRWRSPDPYTGPPAPASRSPDRFARVPGCE